MAGALCQCKMLFNSIGFRADASEARLRSCTKLEGYSRRNTHSLLSFGVRFNRASILSNSQRCCSFRLGSSDPFGVGKVEVLVPGFPACTAGDYVKIETHKTLMIQHECLVQLVS